MSESFKPRYNREQAEALEEETWAAIREAYDKDPTDVHLSWLFLLHHPIFRGDLPLLDHRFKSNLDINIVQVNPETDAIDDNPLLNTKTQVWLECGHTINWRESGDEAVWKYSKDGVVDNVHDYKLGSGGDTFEDAIVNLAEKVRLEYGYDRSKIITPPNKPN
jgi:hypothetical protein